MGYHTGVGGLAPGASGQWRPQEVRPLYPGPEARSDRPLVDAARAGDERAVGELYNAYFPRVYRYMLARTGNVGDAEDLAEEVFIRVLDALGRFEWREAPVLGRLFLIGSHTVHR